MAERSKAPTQKRMLILPRFKLNPRPIFLMKISLDWDWHIVVKFGNIFVNNKTPPALFYSGEKHECAGPCCCCHFSFPPFNRRQNAGSKNNCSLPCRSQRNIWRKQTDLRAAPKFKIRQIYTTNLLIRLAIKLTTVKTRFPSVWENAIYPLIYRNHGQVTWNKSQNVNQSKWEVGKKS